MRRFKGIVSSSGLAAGQIVLLDHSGAMQHRLVRTRGREEAMLQTALQQARRELGRLRQRAREDEKEIFTFQQMLLEDEDLLNRVNQLISQGCSAASAMEQAAAQIAADFAAQSSEYLQARKADVVDACRRVVDILDGRPRRRLHLKRPSVLVADRFFPSDLFSLDRRMVLGLASNQDSTVSHAAIMARSLGIPAVVQLGDGVAAMAVGRRAILDADSGTLVVEPDGAQIAQADCKIALSRLHGQQPDPVAALPCLTKAGTAFRLMPTCNISDSDTPHTRGAAGIGLVRTETVILYDQSVETQTARCRELLKSAEGVPVLLRTCDTHADDDAPWAGELQTRLNGHRLFQPQIKALLRAAADGDLRVVFPMIKDVADWDVCMAEVNVCRSELLEHGFETSPLMLGCVVDMPSAAVMAVDLMEHGAQLLAIDIEDLARYTLGLVQNPTAAVNQLTNPAVLRLVQNILADAAPRGVQVYLCGITVAAVSAMPAYLKIGVRTFSAEPAALLPLKKLLMEQEI